MLFIKNLSAMWRKMVTPEIVYAHCDIPCGIYDPHTAQIAALTTVRMNQLIEALETPSASASEKEKSDYAHAISRYTSVKEEHSEQCKTELRILWADYFKPEHVEEYPDLHAKVFNALKAASKVRQTQDLKAAQDLLSATQDIAEIFWKTKGSTPVKQPSRQGVVGEELVYPS